MPSKTTSPLTTLINAQYSRKIRVWRGEFEVSCVGLADKPTISTGGVLKYAF